MEDKTENQDAEEIYVKRCYVSEGIDAVWNDFYALGAERTEKVYEQNHGPFVKKEVAIKRMEELKKLREQEIKDIGEEGLLKKLGIHSVKATLISPFPPYSKREYLPHSFDFYYSITTVFEPAGSI
jgi:hypothetical protein